MMTLKEFFETALSEEAVATRKMLASVPDDDYDFKPHSKSMTIARLVSHLADIGGWPHLVLTTDALDFAKGEGTEQAITDTATALRIFDNNITNSLTVLGNATEADLDANWIMRAGEMVYVNDTKAAVIRMSLGQMIHHRAQLGVFLRLLDVAIPGPYGPSADEMAAMGY